MYFSADKKVQGMQIIQYEVAYAYIERGDERERLVPFLST
jgi:hypothetical protein